MTVKDLRIETVITRVVYDVARRRLLLFLLITVTVGILNWLVIQKEVNVEVPIRNVKEQKVFNSLAVEDGFEGIMSRKDSYVLIEVQITEAVIATVLLMSTPADGYPKGMHYLSQLKMRIGLGV